MKSVTVRKADLLETLRKNREAHLAIYLEALEGYYKEAFKLLQDQYEELLDAHTKKRLVAIAVYLGQPQNHTKDYDAAIAMLEWSTDETVEVEQKSFRAYVLDEWDWRGNFLMANAQYSATALSMSTAEE